jgi:Sulfotransferase domain
MNVNQTARVNERVFSEYEPDRLTKVIHLIRDPFDNVVSRFHLEREIPGHVAEQFSEDREGFRSYCNEIDSKHKESEKRVIFLSESLLKILNRVPCHEDFIRYIEWHNLAFVTTRDMQLQTFILHYDWYATRYTETAKELLDFLKLRIHKNGLWTPFDVRNVYSDYYTTEEKQALGQAYKMMSSVETWNHISQYFEGFQRNDIVPEVEMVPHRPALDALVKEGSKTDIIGDVQFLLDFAIVGYPKTATSAMTRWLSSHQEIQMYDHEIYYLKDNEPAEMVRALHLLPEGDQFKRGYKAPRDIHNPPAVKAFTRYFPNTKFMIGLRHPVLWFESFYNFRIRSNITLPPPNDMIGDCTKEMYNVCTEEIRYMDHLSAMGKSDRTDPKELDLLSPERRKEQVAQKMNNPVFLYEISQMDETDNALALQYRVDLQQYLGLRLPIGPLTEEKESHDDSPFKDLEIDICDPLFAPVHAELMDIAVKSSIWLRRYFLPLPDVHVSSPDHFEDLIEAWMIDPCVARRNEEQSDE